MKYIGRGPSETVMTTWRALRWAAGFYRDHLPWVLGLSLIPTAQRLLITWPGRDVPTWAAVSSEVVAQLARVVLVIWVLSLLVRELFGRLQPARAWQAFTDGVDRRPWLLASLGLMLACAFVAFDVVPNLLISWWVAEADQDRARSILIAVKNPTVIAMTILWMAGVARISMTPEPTGSGVEPGRASSRPQDPEKDVR